MSLCPKSHPAHEHTHRWGKCILDDGHRGDCAFKILDWPSPERLLIGVTATVPPICPICREVITPDSLDVDERGIRLDSQGKPWCRPCTERFDGLDPEDLHRSYL